MDMLVFSKPYTPLSGWLVGAIGLGMLALLQRYWAWRHRHQDPEGPLARLGAAILAILALLCGLLALSNQDIYFDALHVGRDRVRVDRVEDGPWWIERGDIEAVRVTPIGKNGQRCALNIRLKNGQVYRSTTSRMEQCKVAQMALQR